MEFLAANFFDTTTQISVNSNTVTAEFIISPDVRKQYVSSGYADDSLTSSITITFDSTQTVDRISLLEMNGKKFNIYYNGATANAFALTGPTTTSQFITNSLSSMYLQCTPVACLSVTFDIYSTVVANSEKAIGHIILSENEFSFPKIPASGGYTPLLKSKEFSHELSDGGNRSHFVQTKWDIKMSYKYITQSFRDDLKDIYDTREPFIFVPFGTSSGWDGVIFEANWVGNFDFYKYSDNAVASGYSGSIELKET